jgi:transketolase
LAGTWGLGKLICFWDDNKISIDGNTDGWFTDDTAARFEAYGWQVIRHVNGHDPVEIDQAIRTAQAETGKPTLICCRTAIGFGSPNKQGKESAHGAPLGKDEIALTRAALNWPYAPFEIPADVYDGWRALDAGIEREAAWNALFQAYASVHPEAASELQRRLSGALPENFGEAAADYIAKLQSEGPVVASRKASQMAIETFAPLLPELIGGSADLAHSNLTLWKGSKSVAGSDADANYVYYGVREFGMSAIANGMALHGGFIPYDATFLVFSDYSRNALRMSALIPANVIHVFTHDSIGLGEDGPTHQPIEHMASLRYIPNNDVWRPCDAVESAVSWAEAIKRRTGPSCLIFSRQNLAHQSRSPQQVADIARGAYVLFESKPGFCDVILVATGSEVELAVQAAKQLAEKGVAVRVVSMPSTTVFDRQDAAYRESVLPSACKRRVAVEAGTRDFWYKYVGLEGAVIGMNSFGASAPADQLYVHFGITVDAVVSAVEHLK